MGLKEAKEAVDKYLTSEDDNHDAVFFMAVNHLKGTNGYCIMGDNCHCGGDVPAVRFGCFEWKNLG